MEISRQSRAWDGRHIFILFLILISLCLSSCSASTGYNPLATLVRQATVEKVFFTATSVTQTATPTPTLTATPRYTQPISAENIRDLVEVEQLGGSGYLFWSQQDDQLLSVSNRGVVSYQQDTLEEIGAVDFPVAVFPGTGFFLPGDLLVLRGFWPEPNIYMLSIIDGSITKTIPQGGFPTALASSIDGSVLAIGNPDGTISLWNTTAGRTVKIFRGVQQPSTAPVHFTSKNLIFSPNSQVLLSISTNKILQLWNIENGTLLGKYSNYYEAAFSPDGNYWASIWSLSDLHIRSVADGTLEKVIPILRLALYIEHPTHLLYSPDGQYIAASLSDGTFYVWKIEDESLMFMHTGNGIPINNLAFSPDGSILFLETQEGDIQSWDVATKSLLAFHAGGLGGQGIVYSPDGGIVASVSGTKLFLWDISSSSIVRSAEVLHTGISDMKLSPLGDMVAVTSWTGGTVLYRFPELTLLQGLEAYRSLAFSPDASLLSTCGEENRLWDFVDGEYVRTHFSIYPEPGCTVTTFSPDGEYLVSGSSDGFLHFFDTRELSYHKVQVVGSEITSLAYSPNGAYLAAVFSGNNSIRLLRSGDAFLIKSLFGHTGRVSGFAFSPDGTLLASSSDDNTIRLWRLADTQLLRTIATMLPANDNSISFSPDGTLLSVGFIDGTIRSWALINP